MALSSADPNAFLAVGMQSALGTPQATVGKLRFAKYLSGSNIDSQIDVVDLREGGDGLDFGYTYKKEQKAVGQIVVNARPEIAAALLQGIPGLATWDGASAPAAHTFTTGGPGQAASFPWMSIFAQHPGSTLLWALSDVLFTGLTIEGHNGEPWKITLPFVAITHGASWAAVVPTNYVEEPFLFHYNPTFVLDGSGDLTVTDFKIDMGLGIEELQSQKVTLDDIAVMNRDVNVEITRRYVDATKWKAIQMVGGVQPTVSVATGNFRADSFYAIAGATRLMQVQAPLLSYRDLALTELDPDGKTVYETITAKALKGATAAFFAVVKNAHASVYGP